MAKKIVKAPSARILKNDPKSVRARELQREHRQRQKTGDPAPQRPRYTASQQEEMARLRGEGKGYREIGRTLGVDHQGVRRVLLRIGDPPSP